jgi:hypothetical protein
LSTNTLGGVDPESAGAIVICVSVACAGCASVAIAAEPGETSATTEPQGNAARFAIAVLVATRLADTTWLFAKEPGKRAFTVMAVDPDPSDALAFPVSVVLA